MKKKNIITLVVIVAVAIALVFGTLFVKLKNRSVSDEDHVIELLSEIKGYTSEVTIKVINDKETNVYEGMQKYVKDFGYRLDLSDERSFIFKGDDIEVKDNNSERRYTLDKDFDEVFKYGFIGEYIGLIYTNEELKFQKEVINDKEYFIITTLIPGSNNNLYEGSMYYDIAEYKPSKIIIYDNKHSERVIYSYKNFQWTDKKSDMNIDF